MWKIGLLFIVGASLMAALATALYVSRGAHDAAAQPVGENVATADFQFSWEPDWLDIIGPAAIDPSIHLLQQAPGSQAAVFDPEEILPDTQSPYVGSVVDLGSEETNPPFTHGVLQRYTGQVAADASGVYALRFTPPSYTTVSSGSGTPEDLCAKYGCDLWDGNHSPPYGMVAVGTACPSPSSATATGMVIGFDMNTAGNSCPGTGTSDCTLGTIDSCVSVSPGDSFVFDVFLEGLPAAQPTPTPSATATPTPTSTASPTATVSPTPTATVTPPSPGNTPLVAGWNDACYQGLSLTPSDAFASVASVQAVYRMNPDQTFGRWFPTRPELSTITTLSPFDQLFILMAGDGVWTVQPLAPPALSAALNPGWNSVCYLGGGMDTAAAAAGISGGFSIMYNLPPDQTWRRFVPNNPEVSNLARLETYSSVLVLMTEGGTWTFSP